MPWYRRFWQLTISPTVLWAGLPAAIISAVWLQFRAEGFVWGALWTVSFAIRLVCSIYFVGYVGGRTMAAVFRRAGEAGLMPPNDL